MKFLTFLLLAVLYSSPSLLAQEKEYEDLWVLYIDEDYEKLISKALKVTENDKTKKEPMPYLFVSMGNFEISKKEDMAEDYPKAFRDALKFAAKWRKKDKQSQFVYDNKDYISELREGCMEVAEGYLEDGAYSKSKRYYKYMTQFDPDCPGSWLMYAYSLKKLNDVLGTEEAFGEFEAKLGDIDRLSSEQQRLLKYGLITYAEEMYQEGKRSDAKAMLERGAEFYADDNEYKMVMEDLR
ncbi:MAG: hypothetical protein HKN45_04415 [Flavobacteriales bacterium]|nr:hypothetical protein [Flavobacteriales bacterium]